MKWRGREGGCVCSLQACIPCGRAGGGQVSSADLQPHRQQVPAPPAGGLAGPPSPLLHQASATGSWPRPAIPAAPREMCAFMVSECCHGDLPSVPVGTAAAGA